MRNTVPTMYTAVPTGVTNVIGHVRRNHRSRCRNPAGHLRRHSGHVPGITGHVGPEYSASAIVATVGKGHDFTCGRQFCAWLGLVPGQYSSGGKQRLGRITKAGDPYLRTLLIMGGKAVLAAARNKTDPVSRWAISVQERRGYWKAVVAIAAKNARMCWAMLQHGEAFRMPA